MKLNRPLITAAYLVAVLLILVPLIEVMLSVWPLRFGQTAWRFGPLGLLSQAATTPMVGAVLLFAIAFALNHRRTLMTSAVIAGIIALVMVVSIPLFALDAVQMRSRVSGPATRSFDISAMLATIKLSGLFLLMLLLSWGGLKSVRNQARRSNATVSEPLIAAQR
jgi:hypothetical protein